MNIYIGLVIFNVVTVFILSKLSNIIILPKMSNEYQRLTRFLMKHRLLSIKLDFNRYLKERFISLILYVIPIIPIIVTFSYVYGLYSKESNRKILEKREMNKKVNLSFKVMSELKNYSEILKKERQNGRKDISTLLIVLDKVEKAVVK